MEDTFKVILYLNNGFLVLSTLIGLIKFKHLKNKEKWYVYYIIFLFLIESIVKISIYLLQLENVDFLYPLYVSGELLILGILFIKKSNLSYYWYIPIVFAIGYFLIGNNIGTNELKKVISNIIVISFVGYSLLTEIKKAKINDRFLLVDAFIFMYYAVSVFVFFLLRQLKTFSNDEVYLIWNVNNLLCCFLYISIIYTFLKLKK